MDNWLKGLVAAACVAVLAFVGYFFWGERTRAIEGSEALKAQELIKAQSIDCRTYALEVLKQQDQKPITALTDIAAESREALRLCVKFGRLQPFEQAEFEKTGLSKLFSAAAG